MSNITMDFKSQPAAPAPAPDVEDYRAVCSSSVTSAVIAIIGLSSFWMEGFLLISVVGLLLGISALVTVRRRSDELTGVELAMFAIVICIMTIVAAGGWHTYVYLTEVPDDHQRISYRHLQLEPTQSGNQVPKSAKALVGEKVFIKGFIMPSFKKSGISIFLLCRDDDTCCFGGDPKIHDRILVKLEDDKTIEYTKQQIKIIGEFRVLPNATEALDAPGVVLYEIEGMHLE
jgi:hypothetical protein